MSKIIDELKELDARRVKLLANLKKQKANKRFHCLACNEYHKIKDCDVINTHHYIPPYSCNGGAFWVVSGELQIICPTNPDLKNRILFFKDDWKKRKQQFYNQYNNLFRSVIDDYEKDERYWYNNEYFDKNFNKFVFEY